MNTDGIDRLEGTFYDYLHQLGQLSPEFNRGVLSFYLPMFARCRRVLDVGCGEGQFIEILRNEGVRAQGIDSDSRMVQLCLEKGLDVVQADLFEYLPQHLGQYDGIFSSNLIEHLSSQDAARFIQACYGSLSPGGTLLIATPNPASLIVQLHEFWRDATHVRLYNPSLLEFLFYWVGLEEIESGENPHTSWSPWEVTKQDPQLPQETSVAGNATSRDQAREQTLESGAYESISPLRRVGLSLRRALGQFMVRWILFEEFEPVRQVQRALYDPTDGLLTRPREAFVRGVRPQAGPRD